MSEIRSGSNQDLTSGRNFDPNCLNTFLEEIGDDITGAWYLLICHKKRLLI